MTVKAEMTDVSAETQKRWDGEILIMALPLGILKYVLSTEKDPKLETEDVKNWRQRIFQYLQVCDRYSLSELINRLTEKHCPDNSHPDLLEQSFEHRLMQRWVMIKNEFTQETI